MRTLDKGEASAIKSALQNSLSIMEYDNIVDPTGARTKVIKGVRDVLTHVFGDEVKK